MDNFDSVINLLCNFKSLPGLYNKPVFAIGLLKTMDTETTKLVFDLLVNSMHISRLSSIKTARESSKVLLKMNLAHITNDVIYLDNNFREGLLSGFCTDNFSERFPVRKDSFSLSKQKAEAARLPEEKLHGILKFLVDNRAESSKHIRDVLFYSDLISSNNGITSKGFEFLLNTKKTQVWLLIANAIQFFARDVNEESSMILDLMEICTKHGIEACAPVKESSVWFDFCEALGIFYRCSSDVLIINNSLIFDYSHSSPKVSLHNLQNSHKHLILETNYKIYAYTTKPYEKSILSLFSRIVYTLPNLVKAQFDEESFLAALSRGISVNQILKYLQEFSESVPPNISNQLLIWEAKQNRIKMTSGVLYTDFLHLYDYLKLVEFLKSKNGIIYKDEVKRIIIGSTETHNEAKEFIKAVLKE